MDGSRPSKRTMAELVTEDVAAEKRAKLEERTKDLAPLLNTMDDAIDTRHYLKNMVLEWTALFDRVLETGGVVRLVCVEPLEAAQLNRNEKFVRFVKGQLLQFAVLALLDAVSNTDGLQHLTWFVGKTMEQQEKGRTAFADKLIEDGLRTTELEKAVFGTLECVDASPSPLFYTFVISNVYPDN